MQHSWDIELVVVNEETDRLLKVATIWEPEVGSLKNTDNHATYRQNMLGH